MKTNKVKIISGIKSYLIMTFGVLLVAIGAHFFKFPNAISTGGVTGMAVVFAQVIPFLTASNIVTILNVVLIIVGFIFLGRDFGIKTVYSSLLLSVMLEILDIVAPMSAPLTNQPVLELIYAVAFPAAGSAILFFQGSSSGGTDIVAMIVRKFTNMDSGKALLASDIIFVLLTFYNFATSAFDPLRGLLSLLGLLLKSLVVDNLLESLNQSKKFLCITAKREIVEAFITKELNRSATSWECEGSYTHNKSYAMLTVMSRYQAFRLRAFIKKVDPQAFIIVTSTSDIIGKGFREL